MILKNCVYLFFLMTSLNAYDSWHLPDGQLRYNEACFLTAHNAFANEHDGWYRYKQQRWNIKEQLEHGVRGFMLDTYKHRGSIVLSHGGCGAFYLFQRGIASGISSLFKQHAYVSLKQTMIDIIHWLEIHKEEIVTVFLENYVDSEMLRKELCEIKGFSRLSLSTSDWDPYNRKDGWPLMQWMRENDKRLVVFVEDKSGSPLSTLSFCQGKNLPFFYIWHHIIESSWGSLDSKKISRQRQESSLFDDQNRSLYLLNYFDKVTRSPKSSKRYHDTATLNSMIEHCRQNKLAGGRFPNFLALDFVDCGNPLAVVNSINDKAKKKHGKRCSKKIISLKEGDSIHDSHKQNQPSNSTGGKIISCNDSTSLRNLEGSSITPTLC